MQIARHLELDLWHYSVESDIRENREFFSVFHSSQHQQFREKPARNPGFCAPVIPGWRRPGGP